MSAENWAICPKCKKKRLILIATMENNLLNDYGVIPADEYLKNKEKVDEFKNKPLEESLREDYEVWMDDDGFHMYYGGRCDKCDFFFNFNHQEKLEF